MKKLVLAAVMVALCSFPIKNISAQPATRADVVEEAIEHPRISKAIAELDDAIAYMEAAPHNFGGHKAKAIASCKKARVELLKALAFHARKENR
jgi:hypothetical protein